MYNTKCTPYTYNVDSIALAMNSIYAVHGNILVIHLYIRSFNIYL